MLTSNPANDIRQSKGDIGVEEGFWDECTPFPYSLKDDTCSICGEEVEDAEELRIHLTNQHCVVFDACVSCHKVFPTHLDFTSHSCTSCKHKRDHQTNLFGAVFVPVHKRRKTNHLRSKPAQAQDIMMWHQGYHTNLPGDSQTHVTHELLVQAYSAHDGVPVEMDQVPTTAITCKLCGLLFASSQQMNKHVSFSQKHRRAVDKQRRDLMQQLWQDITCEQEPLQLVTASDALLYRDRSEERRAAMPEAGQQLCYDLSEDVIEFAGKDAPITSTNKGHQLLLSMGWEKGTGLGKNNDGIRCPILPTKLSKNAGLGAVKER